MVPLYPWRNDDIRRIARESSERCCMRHELVICTRNRADDLRQCLESVAAQSNPPCRVVIVDSSDGDSAERVAEEVAGRGSLVIKFVHTAPGLTLQRNAALALIEESTDVIHFVDDDMVLDRDYLRLILSAFREHPNCGGVGGRISNLPKRRAKGIVRWFRYAFLLDSPRPGVLLPSGVGVICRTGDQPRPVDWLSGGSMSYRRRCIAGLRFDESRSGYGMGEDVDFSARVAGRAPLVWTPLAVIEHRYPFNHGDNIQLRRRAVRSRWQLAKHGVGSVIRAAVVYAVIGDALMLLAMAGVFRSRHHARQACATLVGLVDVIKGLPV
ncbi:glycosyltransferase family 2 protein [Streptomyces canus]|nr:glycosyltransferase family 2 protein [Streptomyces canus]